MSNPIRILYVDDNPHDRELVRDALEKEHGGFELVSTASRADFETAFAKGGFDLVLSDFNILGFDGLQVLEIVQAKDSNLPVVVVTGTGSEETAVEALKRGAADYVIKTPAHIQHLPHTIRAVLERKNLDEKRRQAEKAVSISEEKYRRIVETAQEGIWVIDTESRTTFINQKMAQLLGYSVESMTGRSLFEFMDEEGQAQAAANVERRRQNIAEQHDFKFQRKDGSGLWTIVETSPIFDQNGQYAGALAMVTDITERKLAEKKLRESEEKFKTLFDSADDAIFIMNHTVFLDCNASTEKIFQCSRDQIIGKSPLDFSPELQPDGRLSSTLAAEKVEAAFAGEPQFFEWIHTYLDGTLFDAEVSLSRVFIGGGFILQAIVRDISERKQAREALQTSEQRYRTLFEDSPIALWEEDFSEAKKYLDSLREQGITDIRGYLTRNPEEISNIAAMVRVLDVNKAALRMYKVNKKEDLYTNLQHIFLPESLLSFKEELIAIAENKTEFAWDGKDSNFNGEPINVSLRWSVTPDNVNSYSKVIVSIIDITERKKAEGMLRESEEKFKALWESTVEGIIIHERGIILEVNQSALDLFGITREQAIGKSILEFAPPENRERLREKIESQDLDPYETNIVSSDGASHIIEVIRKKTKHQGRDARIVSIRDMTERKQAENEIRRLKDFDEALINNMGEGIIVQNTEGVFTFVNPAASEITGYSSEELLGQHWTKFFLADQQKFINEADNQRLAGQSSKYEIEFLHKNENRIYILVSGSPLFENGRFNGTIAVFIDITERKQAEETIQQYAVDLERRVEERTVDLIRANRAKDEFLASMSHELRTPLNAVLGMSESLQEGVYGEITPRQIEVLRTIAESGHHLLELINDILDLSKIEAGKLELLAEPVAVEAYCQASIRMIKETAFLKSIQVSMSNTSNIEMIHADGRRLKQMLVNLLGNAVKFTPPGGQVELVVSKESDYAIRFSVRDTGIGIPADQLEKLFKPFVQLDSSLARQYGGTGLGLALVRELAELHGGSVGVESKLGRGSRFYFILPIQSINILIVESAILSAGPKPKETTTHPNGEKKRILLAEDNVTNMLVTSDYLNDKGYQVIRAGNGLEAVEQALENKPDLILMDIQIPGINGFEVIKRIRAAPGFDSVPIIALTALAMPGDRERCLEAGANEYLTKPVGLKALTQMIESLL